MGVDVRENKNQTTVDDLKIMLVLCVCVCVCLCEKKLSAPRKATLWGKL